MKLFSLDIETTGKNENKHQIIEVGGVIDDLENPKDLNDLPEFHCYVTHDVYNISEFCLGMHTKTGIFESISNRKEDKKYIPKEKLKYHLGKFVYKNYLDENEKVDKFENGKFSWSELHRNERSVRTELLHNFLPMRVVAAGKNFGTFDRSFLYNLEGFESTIRFDDRIMDPGPLYAKPSDEGIPGMETCVERAGLEDDVTHHAVDDSKIVVKLIRNHFGIDY